MRTGSEWLIANKIADAATISPLGRKVADLLGDLYGGIYHIDDKQLRAVDWAYPHHIEFFTTDSFATTDFNNLTHLVFLAHDYCVRVQIDAKPHGKHELRLRFHPRQRTGTWSETHWTIEQAVASYRDRNPAPKEETHAND